MLRTTKESSKRLYFDFGCNLGEIYWYRGLRLHCVSITGNHEEDALNQYHLFRPLYSPRGVASATVLLVGCRFVGSADTMCCFNTAPTPSHRPPDPRVKIPPCRIGKHRLGHGQLTLISPCDPVPILQPAGCARRRDTTEPIKF